MRESEYEVLYKVHGHKRKSVITSFDKNSAIEKLKTKLLQEGVISSSIEIIKIERIGYI